MTNADLVLATQKPANVVGQTTRGLIADGASKTANAPKRTRRLLSVAVAVAAASGFASPSWGSQALPDKDIRNAKLAVNTRGEALVSYLRSTGDPRHVLLWGAVNARAASSGKSQVRFSEDAAGGYGKYRNGKYWRTFKDACRPYDGPSLAYLVAACKAPDGSYWALQSWRRNRPNLGFAPWLASQREVETQVSHWTGPLPVLTVAEHWTYDHAWVGLFGRLTYRGQPVHGFAATPTGNPHDRYGRNVYIDTFDSAYGRGWARESGILLHTPGGTFCHSFVPQTPFPGYPSRAPRPAAPGARYRVTVMGPGVTPVIRWEKSGLSPRWTASAAQKAAAAAADVLWAAFMGADRRCAPEQGGS